MLDRDETNYPTLKELATLISTTPQTIIKYNEILASKHLISIQKDGKHNIYTIFDPCIENTSVTVKKKISPVKELVIYLYNLLGKPPKFSFAKECGIVKKLLKKYSKEDIMYGVRYVKISRNKYPASVGWLINNECVLLDEAIEYRNKQADSIDRMINNNKQVNFEPQNNTVDYRNATVISEHTKSLAEKMRGL